MNASWYENLSLCRDWYFPQTPTRVLDLLPADEAVACRGLWPNGVVQHSMDVAAHPSAPLSCPDQSVDVVVACQPISQGQSIADLHPEIDRVLAPEGMAFIIMPLDDPNHDFTSVDRHNGAGAHPTPGCKSEMRLVHAWTDQRGPEKMVMAVFQKGGSALPRTAPPAPTQMSYLQQDKNSDAAAETTGGARHYLEVLAEIHSLLRPERYLEIGIRHGRSLRLAQCPTVAVDPQPEVDPLPDNVQLFTCSSDDFFFFHAAEAVGDTGFNLAFIDGMHLSEYAFRDFLNVEPLMSPDGVIVIDDVLPNHPVQAQRLRQSRVWTGDVWRLGVLLKERRPDLKLTWLDTSPTGLLLISRLNPANRLLSDSYNTILRAWVATAEARPPEEILSRSIAQNPDRITLLQATGI